MKFTNDLGKKLNEIEKKAKGINNQSVSMTDLLTPDFVAKHTRFANADEMFGASGFKIESQEDFAAIPDEKWDEFIRSASSFSSWQEMLGKAGELWAIKQLGL
ncbi:MAG: hypothetical protein KF892_24095 [Rhizobacter sp.]|nr:hypothetical protein [Rhizobacter sp.]